MPVDRVLRPISRSSPLPKGRYTIPSTLPPAFGVSELYDWSAKTSSSSSRSSSAGHSTFQRHSEKRGASASVRTWVDDQGIHSPGGSVRHEHSPSISAADTRTRRPLFAPSRSPTPSKRGSSQVPLQLPSPAPSPLKPQSRPKPTSNTLDRPRSPSTNRNSYTSSISTSNIRASATYPARRPEDIFSNSADSEVEVLSASDEDEDDEPYGNTTRGYLSEDLSEDESEDLEDDESELGESGRMRASRYIDCSARETSTRVQHSMDGGGRWTGATQGLLSFRKRPNSQEVLLPGKWTFSNDGVARQSLKDREAGDIHFSPAFAGESGEDYWVCVDQPKRRWTQCSEGQAHPTAVGYVMRPREGTKPPQWILAQSFRANKSRGRQRL
ncbi:hypothetical protein FRC12_016844 [Ceratobasidium sp. 428]|nr:hypothetical protein FRC12_016844 [Ceratobasidium sp. 428]